MSLQDQIEPKDAADPRSYAQRVEALARESKAENAHHNRLLNGPVGFRVKPGMDQNRLTATKAEAVVAHVTVNAISDAAQTQRAIARELATGAFSGSKFGPTNGIYSRATLEPLALRENAVEAAARGIDLTAVHRALYHFALADELYARSNRLAKETAAVRQLADSLEAAAFEGAVTGLQALPRTGL